MNQMPDIPRAVLSEHLQETMRGRRLVSAVFLTYRFDPGFFEQEILPVLLDVPLSHAIPIRLLQLEDALRSLPGQIAVYFDVNGIRTATSSAKLDVRRIPIHHHTGIFHPKNLFLLVEEQPTDTAMPPARTLIVASMSANLTRAGWWENVEGCHVEQIAEGDRTRLRDDLETFLLMIRGKAASRTDHEALNGMLALLRGTEQRAKKSINDQLHRHFPRDHLPVFRRRERLSSIGNPGRAIPTKRGARVPAAVSCRRRPLRPRPLRCCPGYPRCPVGPFTEGPLAPRNKC